MYARGNEGSDEQPQTALMVQKGANRWGGLSGDGFGEAEHRGGRGGSAL